MIYDDPSGHSLEDIKDKLKKAYKKVGDITNTIVTTYDGIVNEGINYVESGLDSGCNYINSGINAGFERFEQSTGINQTFAAPYYNAAKAKIQENVGEAEGGVKEVVSMGTGLVSFASQSNPIIAPVRSVNNAINTVDTAGNIYNAVGYGIEHRNEIYGNRNEIFNNVKNQAISTGIDAYNYMQNPYNRGQLMGRAKVFVGSFFIGAGEANAASKMGEAGKAENLLSKMSRLFGKSGNVENNFSNFKLGNFLKNSFSSEAGSLFPNSSRVGNTSVRTPPLQVNGGTFNVEVPLARRTGTGVVPDAYNANIRILGSDGKTRNVWREVSGNATEFEMALGTGLMRQATHTEQRALT